MELMVALAITSIIVTVLVSVTSIAMETWNRSRSELRASRQAKSMIDSMAKDLECLVARRGNTNEWLSALSETAANLPGSSNLKSTNASRLIFFASVTDRYNGEIGKAADLGGDVSCLAYQLEYKNAIRPLDAGFRTFILRRVQKNPNLAFTDLMGKTDSTVAAKSLDNIFIAAYPSDLSDAKNFVCENIYQFSLTFNVEVNVAGVLTNVPVTVAQTNGAQTTTSFRITGAGITTGITGGTVTAAQVATGRVTSVQISVSVLSDFGVEQARTRTFTTATQADFLAKNSYQYSKLVQLPTM
jgi:type II secretory pathway pseudopilin PulG